MTIETSPLGSLYLAGSANSPIWGMTTAERARRMANEAAKKGQRVAEGYSLAISLAHVFDPLLLREAMKAPGTVFTLDGALLVGQIPVGQENVRPVAGPGITLVELAGGHRIYNAQLRKLEQPFAQPLTATNRRAIERQSYYGAYKGVTDILTKYLWPELALWLTRLAATLRMTPNMVSAIGAVLCVAATFLFAGGMYWSGMLAGFIFMVLDTVDGKLARCTITSSKWGNVIDHGIDLVHPPFWWYFWGTGLVYWGLALSPRNFALVMLAIVGGYVLQRLIEGIFMRAFGNGTTHIHVWRPFDTWFRLITARRNPNMVILFASLLIGRPDLGIVAVAWWTMISLVVHAVRLAQAYIARGQGKPVTSWLEEQPA